MRKRSPFSVARLLLRCNEEGDCLVWPGRMKSGSPIAFNTETRKEMMFRKLVYQESGRVLKPGHHPIMTCRNPRCLLVAHMKPMTASEICLLAAKEGKFSTPHRRAAVSAGVRRRKNLTLNLELARTIRDDPASQRKKALIYGVHRSTVQRIESGESWREQVSGASIFNR